MADLSPAEIAFFAQQRRRIEDAFNQGSAQNAFEVKTLGGEKTRQLAELAAQLDAIRQGIAGDYAQGGTLNSGLYQKAISDFNAGAQRQTGLLSSSFSDKISALNLAKQQLEQTRASSLSDVSQQEATRKAELAAAITSALQGQGFGGGAGVGTSGGGRPTYSPRSPRRPYRPRTGRSSWSGGKGGATLTPGRSTTRGATLAPRGVKAFGTLRKAPRRRPSGGTMRYA
jgi:hypothetical protein